MILWDPRGSVLFGWDLETYKQVGLAGGGATLNLGHEFRVCVGGMLSAFFCFWRGDSLNDCGER